MQRKGYARSFYERSGLVNVRSSTPRSETSSTTTEPLKRIIFVTKRKGFGSLGNKESALLSEEGTEIMKQSFPAESYHRYRINIRCKGEAQ